MPTNTRGAGAGTNVWSDITAWSQGWVPVDGETADLAGYVVTMDVAAIPATGVLAGIISPGTAGQLLVPLNVLAANVVINANIITAGTKSGGGLIVTTGSSSFRLTVNAVTITGGAFNGSYGIWRSGANNGLTINATDVNGGSYATSYGIYSGNVAGDFVLNTTNITGGSAGNAHGVVVYRGTAAINCSNIIGGTTGALSSVANGFFGWYASGTVVLSNCNLIYSITCEPVGGVFPSTWNITNGYIQMPDGTKFAVQLLDHQILAGVVNGSITGNRVDCPVAKAVTTSGNYGDPDSPFVGTVVEKNYPIIDGYHIIKPARAA